MDSVDIEVLKRAVEWQRSQCRLTLVTVAKTWGSAPRPAGAMLLIRDDGQVMGSVSGGCVEDDLIERVRSGAFALLKPEIATYGVTREQAERFGLPCGGTLQLVLEPLSKHSKLGELLAAIERSELVVRTLDLQTGAVQLKSGCRADRIELTGDRLRTVHGPLWRLLIIGAGQPSRYLAQMAQALDYQVTVCEPREEYASSWDVPNTSLVQTMPDDTVLGMNLDPHSAVVALTHDPKLDDMALLEALKSAAFYVGALGSRRNNAARRRRLALFDLSDDEIARLHGPVGLAIGSRTPPEIAVSILAEMIAVRHGARHSSFDASPAAELDQGTCARHTAAQ